MPHPSKSGGKETTFRLGLEYRRELEERAAADDLTLSEYLRRLVRDHLEPSDHDQLIDDVEGLRHEVRMLREDTLFVVETLLIDVAKFSKDKVKSVMETRLKRG